MEVKFACLRCGQHLSAMVDQGGAVFPCPGCGASLTVPIVTSEQASPIVSADVSKAHDRTKWLAPASLGAGALGIILACFNHAGLWIFCSLLALVLGHLARRKIRLSPTPLPGKKVALAGLIIGYIPVAYFAVALGILILVGVASLFVDSHASPATTNQGSTATPSVRVEQVMTNHLQKILGDNKQQIFDHLHPVGTAKNLTVHDVTVTAWKHGQDTNRFDDVREFTVRYTLFWEGPITKDGFTKISATYDTESQHYTASQILATNGMTNSDAGNAAVNLFGTWLQYEAQKEGAEKATWDYYHGQ